MPALTAARRRGLLAFGTSGMARESNVTDVDHGLVYWQTRAWLEREGYIEWWMHTPDGAFYRLTASGKLLQAEAIDGLTRITTPSGDTDVSRDIQQLVNEGRLAVGPEGELYEPGPPPSTG